MKEISFDENRILQCLSEEELNDESLTAQFTLFIRDLILYDFEKLIFLLYRIDVHENKLRDILSQHPNEDSAAIIAKMIIERQAQKIKTRKENRSESTSDEEKW